jgi:hypothetical protein
MLIVRNPLKETHFHFFWVLSLCSCLNFLLLGSQLLNNKHYFQILTQELFFSLLHFFSFFYIQMEIGRKLQNKAN